MIDSALGVSDAALRMRRSRRRRCNGMRSLTIELRETEIDNLVLKNLLSAKARDDPNAVRSALYGFFDRALRTTS